jgi:hypothetical protein
MRPLSLLIAGMALLLLPATAPANAHKKKGMTLGPVVTATFTGPATTTPGGLSIATATCPEGLRALGGGFTAPFGSQSAMVVTSSYRNSPSSWQVVGTLVSGSGAATAYAYCRRTTLRVTDVAVTGTLPSGSGARTTVAAECARRTVPIGGGFQMTSGPDPAHLPIPNENIGGDRLSGTMLPVHEWRVGAQNSNTGEQAIVAHAYCAGGIKRPAFTQKQGSASVPLFGSVTESSACPAPLKRKKGATRTVRRLSAGGFFSVTVPGVLPVHSDSRIVGNAFIGTAVNGGSVTGPLAVQSQAICF